MIDKSTPEKVYMHRNPLYDEILTVYSPVDKIPAYGRKNKLYQKEIRDKLIEVLKHRENKTIYKDKLVFSIHIFGSERDISKTDADNYAKFILDTYKGHLFEDDKQIYTLMVFKEASQHNGVWIGIKKFDTQMPCYPYFPVYSNFPIWTEEFFRAAASHLCAYPVKA